jgi:2-succinyl-6-hydroxy-2,4-cyclohexadiene-1-carboxylate synthase
MKSECEQKSGSALILALHGFGGDPYDFEPLASLMGSGCGWRFVTLPLHETLPHSLPVQDPWIDFVSRLQEVWDESVASQRPLWVLGYSMGARLWLQAWKYLRWPLAGMVLVGCNPGIIDAQERFLRWADDARWARVLREEGVGSFFEQWMAQALLSSQRDLPGYAERLARKHQFDPDLLARALLEFSPGGMDPLWDLVPELNVPCHLLHGEEDGKYARIHQRMAEVNPLLSLAAIPGAGHAPHLEAIASTAARLRGILGLES